jgi:hypothetical protein
MAPSWRMAATRPATSRQGAAHREGSYGGRVPDPVDREPVVGTVLPSHADEVHRITDAGVPLSQEQAGRTRMYFVTMGIRSLCFVGAVLAPSPWRWVLAVGAIVLPYFAVVLANAGRERADGEGFSLVVVRPGRREIGRSD